MTAGKSNLNKAKGISNEKRSRLLKAKRARTKGSPTVLSVKVLSKKKQKHLEKAIRNEKKLLASKGYIEMEEEMKDAVALAPERRRVVVEIPEEILAASASGPGTTLMGVY
ncbi:hypothetical protein BJ944DRAFT_258637 [Cunninghamella echinulata]|nr:hypothetical protein BJ944DRAFT_258637 [Cunninghamella echinulata]